MAAIASTAEIVPPVLLASARRAMALAIIAFGPGAASLDWLFRLDR